MKSIFLIFAILLVTTTWITPSHADCQYTLELANQTLYPLKEFCKNLYEKIIESKPDSNIVYSPVSIALALALVESGAGGQTQTELKKVLAPSGYNGEVGQLYQSLQHHLKIESDKVRLSVANGLFYDNNFNLKAEYLNGAVKCFETAVEKVDFAQAEPTRQKINNWVSNATAEKISELLKQGVIGPDTVAVLANAIYLKAAWEEKFEQLEDRKFFSLAKAEKAKMVKFFKRTGRYSYASNSDIEMVEIPYADPSIGMFIVKAKAANTGITSVESKLGSLAQLYDLAQMKRVALTLPRFTIRLPIDLNTILGQLGMGDMFSNRADLSRMDPTKSIKISKVVHEAYIKVNENGTEAAAATGVAISLKSLPHPPSEEPIPFVADYPFLFFIEHKPTGALLFTGKVNSIDDEN